ncbi:MAG: hypothetical protein HZB13_05515 [Acidobacteria bacterium]|nr:hypothetical protein [Acidobacteriota bacterium]
MKRKRSQPRPVAPPPLRSHSPLWPLLQAVLILASSLFISFTVWAPSLEADWGPIDDHVIHTLLGPDHRMSLAEVPAVAWGAEVSHPGASLRYRPAYWFITALECVFFGDSVRAWYLSRVVGFALMLAGAWFLLARFAGFLLGSGFALLLSVHPYWGSIWACLGPGEPFAALGCILGGLGFWVVYISSGSAASGSARAFGWWMILAGGLVAIGSKENLPFLALPPAWLAWREWRTGRLSRLAATCSTILLAYAAFISLAVVVALARHGADVYSRPVGISTRLQVVWRGLSGEPLLLICLCLAALAAGVLQWAAASWSRFLPWRRAARLCLAWEAILVVLYATQLVFYNGPWERNFRYAFPGETLLSFAWFIPAALLWRAWPVVPGRWAASRRILAAAGCAAMLFAVHRTGYSSLTEAAERNRAKTTAWAGVLRNLAFRTRSSPDAVLVIYSRSLNDFEAIDASRQYLRYLGVPNPVVLQLDPGFSNGELMPAQAGELLQTLKSYASGKGGYASPSLLETAQECLIISFGPPPPGRCRFGNTLPR